MARKNKPQQTESPKPATPKAPAKPQTPATTSEHRFTHGEGEQQQTFKILLPKMHIPGMGELTAADVAADAEAQKYLVDNGTHGSVIELVVE